MTRGEQGRRIQIVMGEDAFQLLQRLTTPRRKGEYLSELVRRAAAVQAAPHPDGIELLGRIAESLARIEEKLDEPEGRSARPPAEPQAPVQG